MCIRDSDSLDHIMAISGSSNADGAVGINMPNSSADLIPEALTVMGNISSSGNLYAITSSVDNILLPNNGQIGSPAHPNAIQFGYLGMDALLFNSTANHFTNQVNFSSVVDIQDTTDATDASGDTGALRVEGGASIAKKVFVGTDLNVGDDIILSLIHI